MVKRKLNKDFAFELEINPSSSEYFSFSDNKDTDDYAPFKNIQVLNTGTQDVKIYLNNQKGFKLIPAGTIFDRQAQSISYLKIENTSTINNAKVTLTLDNDFSQIELLKALVLGREELER